jgi:hypothetical protein
MATAVDKISIYNSSEWSRVFQAEIARNNDVASTECCKDSMVSGAAGASSAAAFTFSSVANWPLYLSLVTLGLALLGYCVYNLLTSGQIYQDNVNYLQTHHSTVTNSSFQTFVMREGLGEKFTFPQLLNICRFYDESVTLTQKERDTRKAAIKASLLT